jgi:biotin operon repressor
MKRKLSLIAGTVLVCFCLSTSIQSQTADEWNTVASAMGKAGTMQPGGVYKIALPRTDLQVNAYGVRIAAALALGSWVAFKKMEMGTDCMVMGDLVLTEDEVNPVMAKLEQGGIEIAALHNHLLEESPHIMYMHIGAIGQPQKLAAAIRSALALSKTPFGDSPGNTAPSDLDVKQLDSVMGRPGKLNGGVIQYSIPRMEKITEHGMEIPPAMGGATAINFESTGAGNAAITGDFVLKATEVNEVIRSLRANGIAITALHSHMLEEEPRLFFMHFWANDEAVKLALSLRAALDRTNSAK